MSETCCTWFTENTGCKNDAKKSPSAHYHTALSCYIFATKARIDNRKKNFLNSNISSTCPHSMANFSPLTAKIFWRVWGTPAHFNGLRILASLLQRRRSPEANQTLHNVWPSPGLLHYIYIFGGSCPTEFCLMQNSLNVQVLRFPILAALLHGIPAAGVSQTLQRGTRNGITELLQRTPSLFGRAAITLGIGPHSSYICSAMDDVVLTGVLCGCPFSRVAVFALM